ncbi:glycogen metabolism-related protein [Papiliotrema laurentii]|uniref:Glycogen metabolism-related protein n=1 Tax=Papiliotrema laurentii TaxID=5418 RepID=A0AAD9CUS2_PAPLA|nr:glycogen metabolism-related protein [Papiliotrema laurentii]
MSDPNSTGPRTLDGRPAEAPPEGWGRPAQQQSRRAAPQSGGIATLFNTGLHAGLSGGGPPGAGDDSDEEGGPRPDPQEFYAGGQNSGIAVQDPTQGGAQGGARGLVDRILRQAARNGSAAPPPQDAPRSSFFGGSGHVLGSEDDHGPEASQPPCSSTHPAPSGGPQVGFVSPSMMDQLLGSMFGGSGGARGAPPPPAADDDDEDEDEGEVQVRHLTFWRNGFSIEDGPLMSYDEPGNKELLDAIHAGRAPPSLFGVRYNQPLQVVVAQKTGEDYRPPPKKPVKAFGGGGHRLGSPVPTVSEGGSGHASPAMPGGFGGGSPAPAGPSAATPSASTSTFQVDETKPTTSIQVRLGDGTRIIAKVNLTHTIADLRNFVQAARPDSRPFILQTTFPSKELADGTETIEGAKLQNAVVVQRFT